ncbi:hypothetical protein [Xenorhabdus bovienii]|nr:hypothetical protein [Xenorhabdus bovienii]
MGFRFTLNRDMLSPRFFPVCPHLLNPLNRPPDNGPVMLRA